MDIAYVQNHILSGEAFYTLMLVAFMLNISVPVTISLWKRHYAGYRHAGAENSVETRRVKESPAINNPANNISAPPTDAGISADY